jgi:ATP-binding cassette subfamily B protein
MLRKRGRSAAAIGTLLHPRLKLLHHCHCSTVAGKRSPDKRPPDEFRRHLLRLAWPERQRFAGGLVLLVGSSSISVVFPKVMGAVMDSCLAGGGDSWTPAAAATALFGLFSAQSIMVAVRGRLMAVAGERVAARLRAETFTSLLLRHDVAFFDRVRSGDLQSRLTADCSSLQKLVVSDAISALRAGLMATGAGVAMLSISPSLFCISLLSFPPAVVLARRMGETMRERQRQVQEALGEAGAEAERALGNVHTLKLFAAEGEALERYGAKVTTARRRAEEVGAAQALSEAGVGLALQSSALLVLAVGGQQILDGTLTYGDLSAFLLYSMMTGFGAGNVATAYSEFRRASGASERVMQLLEPRPADLERERSVTLQLPTSTPIGTNTTPIMPITTPMGPNTTPIMPITTPMGTNTTPRVTITTPMRPSTTPTVPITTPPGFSSMATATRQSPATALPRIDAVGAAGAPATALPRIDAVGAAGAVGAMAVGQIEFEGVSFAYPSAPHRPVLSGLDLHVAAGERVALVGASGSGKSTIAALLAGLYAPQRGRVLLGGVDVDTIERVHLRTRLLSVVPQEPALFSGSLRENLLVGRPGATEAELRAAADAAGCADFADLHWTRDVGERGLQLSGGQKQRVALARVLLRDTPIVILDEFSSALDGKMEASLVNGLQRALAGRTLLLITHRTSPLGLVERVINLPSFANTDVGGG